MQGDMGVPGLPGIQGPAVRNFYLCYNSLLNHGRLLNSMFAQLEYNACYFEFSINGLLEKGNMIHPVFIISIQWKILVQYFCRMFNETINIQSSQETP